MIPVIHRQLRLSRRTARAGLGDGSVATRTGTAYALARDTADTPRTRRRTGPDTATGRRRSVGPVGAPHGP
jgi:hypothetical protein